MRSVCRAVADPPEDESYHVVLTASALRGLADFPPRFADALVAFIFGGLAASPRRRGKPLQRELTGQWSARRGDFRILYRLDDQTKTMYVLKVAGRSDIYRS